MVSVELRNVGQAVWRALTLPTSIAAAQTLASTVKRLNLADEVRITPSGPPPAEKGKVDISI